MKSRQITMADLAQFTGTENYFKHWSKRIVFTDGVRFLAESVDAFWLIDLITSYQPLDVERQYWTLKTGGRGF